MFEEIDYILEAQNAERFSSLFASNVLESWSSSLFLFFLFT